LRPNFRKDARETEEGGLLYKMTHMTEKERERERERENDTFV
jgi:hypothetical protein